MATSPFSRVPVGRVVAINAGAIIAAALVLVISPATIRARSRATEIVVLAVGMVVLLGVNLWSCAAPSSRCSGSRR